MDTVAFSLQRCLFNTISARTNSCHFTYFIIISTPYQCDCIQDETKWVHQQNKYFKFRFRNGLKTQLMLNVGHGINNDSTTKYFQKKHLTEKVAIPKASNKKMLIPNNTFMWWGSLPILRQGWTFYLLHASRTYIASIIVSYALLRLLLSFHKA